MEGRMIRYLAQAVREAREESGTPQRHVAQAGDFDTARVSRFEQGAWPRDPGAMIDAYAQALNVEAKDLWERALELWAAEAVDDAAREIRKGDTERP